MHAGIGFHGRLNVEGILNAITLFGNRKDSRMHDRIEWIALLLGGHSVADREVVINVGTGQEQSDYEQRSFQNQTHVIDSPMSVAGQIVSYQWMHIALRSFIALIQTILIQKGPERVARGLFADFGLGEST